MNVPTGHELYNRAELVITLPGDWPALHQIQAMPRSKAKKFKWPILAIKDIARIPYLPDSFIGPGHTTQAGRDIRDTYRGSDFSGVLIGSVSSMDQDVFSLDVDDSPIHFHGVYPLYSDELTFCRNRAFGSGSHEFYPRLYDAGIHEGVFPDRKILV